ncbi:bacillithiol biosynthesis cysteine-adding enzyme BshC [Wenyingzhuangia sp. IMCC45533]
MESQGIQYKETGYFSKIIEDYLEQKKSIRPFYNRFPTLDNFQAQIDEKSASFSTKTRKVLVKALNSQYQKVKISALTQQNIDDLTLGNTFTVTTGHQLNLFSGPLYFLYKIISVINLCKELAEKYPAQNFVPVYWMASEDHDFEEIQYFNFKGNILAWNRKGGGAVGRLSNEGLDEVFEQFSNLLNSGDNANELRDIFKTSYLETNNLSDASRNLVNRLFGEHGLVIIDSDDKDLKSLFKPYALRELKENLSNKHVAKTSKSLEDNHYNAQVHSREINLFYVGEGFRERILYENGIYKVNNTELRFSRAEALFDNADKLEFVSGNALLRPLYQEVILPNLCYVGGGGELAYWLQLKNTFHAFDVPFPMLLLRNSALLISKKQIKKLNNLSLSVKDLFKTQNQLITDKVKENTDINYDFESKRTQLKNTFKELEVLAAKTDKSFIGAVKAQESKQLKGLNKLEKRLLKAEKKKMYELVTRIEILHHQLFPNNSLQERQHNFSEYYESYGKELITELFESLKPLRQEFTVLVDK